MRLSKVLIPVYMPVWMHAALHSLKLRFSKASDSLPELFGDRQMKRSFVAFRFQEGSAEFFDSETSFGNPAILSRLAGRTLLMALEKIELPSCGG